MQLPSILQRFGYSPLGKESSTDDALNPNRLHMNSPWSSKRWRVVFLVGLVLLLVTGATYYRDHLVLPENPLSHPSTTPNTGSSADPTPSSGHLVSSNHDILEAVAGSIDWARFSYIQYVTNVLYLCNSVMLFAILDRLGCRPDRLMMYPEQWTISESQDGEGDESRLLRIARDKYKVKLQPIHVQSKTASDPTWAESFTKLLAWNQTQYDRVLGLDSDSTVLQCMDELFLMPSAPIAMPRAYWIWNDHDELSSQLILIEPNATEFDHVMRVTESSAGGKYDMDILNDMYLASATIIPHRDYDLLTGEFKNKGPKDHKMYLGSDEAVWDAKTELARAKFLHFSDWPIPKPWLNAPQGTLNAHGPKCTDDGDCTEKDLWYGFYGDFKDRRKAVCNM